MDWGLASFLFAGDVEQEGRASFPDAGRPALAVISVGRRNPFNHPTAEVVERLGQAGVQVFRTDRDGAVIVETDGALLTITRWAARATESYRLDAAP